MNQQCLNPSTTSDDMEKANTVPPSFPAASNVVFVVYEYILGKDVRRT